MGPHLPPVQRDDKQAKAEFSAFPVQLSATQPFRTTARPALNTDSPPPVSRWGLHGDFPYRILRAVALACPWYLQRPLILLWAGAIALVAHGQRERLTGNLRTLGVKRPRFCAWLAFQRMGQIMVETMQTKERPEDVQWEVHDRTCLEAAQAAGKPVLLWTAHMGNYDAAAAFFAHRIGAKLYAVRKPELSARLQALREAEQRAPGGGTHESVFNTEEMLGLTLLRELQAGQWVALQADRALDGLSSFEMEDSGETWRLPRGPFFMAMLAGAVCLPVFVARIGQRRFSVRFYPPVAAPATRDREAAVHSLAREWLRVLRCEIRRHPEQWLVFESLVRPATHASA